jgi:hypothetical protein
MPLLLQLIALPHLRFTALWQRGERDSAKRSTTSCCSYRRSASPGDRSSRQYPHHCCHDAPTAATVRSEAAPAPHSEAARPPAGAPAAAPPPAARAPSIAPANPIPRHQRNSSGGRPLLTPSLRHRAIVTVESMPRRCGLRRADLLQGALAEDSARKLLLLVAFTRQTIIHQTHVTPIYANSHAHTPAPATHLLTALALAALGVQLLADLTHLLLRIRRPPRLLVRLLLSLACLLRLAQRG